MKVEAMRSSNTHSHRQTSFLGEALCDGDQFTEQIAFEDKTMVNERCPGNYVNMVDCHCPNVQDFIDEVKSLDLMTKDIKGITPLIDDVLPIIPKEWFDNPPESVSSEVVGIRLGDVLTHEPYRNNAGVLKINPEASFDFSALQRPVFKGKKVVLVPTGPDTVIETLWFHRYSNEMFDAIASAGFYAVTGMNFSLFLHECPLGHLINLNKSLLFCEELDKRGVPVIPHVYAINDKQRAMWVHYLRKHPNIRTVLINTQMQRDYASMKEVERTTQSLLDATEVNVILNGFQPKEPSWGVNNRVIVSNQFNMKQVQIINNSIERQHAQIIEVLNVTSKKEKQHRTPLLKA
jgi:hypothetical protein